MKHDLNKEMISLFIPLMVEVFSLVSTNEFFFLLQISLISYNSVYKAIKFYNENVS